MTLTHLRGQRIHFAGSSDLDANLFFLTYSHDLLKFLTHQFLLNGVGLVVQLGDEPKHKSANIPIIFDWTILEAANECIKSKPISWPKSQGAPIVVVGFSKSLKKIPPERRELWEKLLSSGCVELKLIKRELSIGGILREIQASYGDVLITLGGGVGIHHIAEIYLEHKKTVIPLSLNIKKENASLSLVTRAYEEPTTFFNYINNEKSLSAYSTLNLEKLIKPEEFWEKLKGFLEGIKKPHAFYVRLQNDEIPEYKLVENYFRTVIDKIVSDVGYDKYELGISRSEDIFMNVELFKKLHYSSLVIVDMTAVRPNCCIELGYVLGLRKKIIITAMKGTKLPWDITSIRCHYWDPGEKNEEKIKELTTFMENNIIRGPLIKNELEK